MVLQWSYNCVKVVLQLCHSVSTVLPQWCYSGVVEEREDTRVVKMPNLILIEEWCNSIIVVSPWYHSGVKMVSQWCHSGVIAVLQWSYNGVTVVLQWCYIRVVEMPNLVLLPLR
jgi:hypothetical protein